MSLPTIIAEARKRQQYRELEQALLQQFGEEVGYWFHPICGFDADGAPEIRLTHNGTQVAVWRDNDGARYVEGEALAFDPSDLDAAGDAFLVAIDDLAPAAIEQVTEA
jgi:hypothetical protein